MPCKAAVAEGLPSLNIFNNDDNNNNNNNDISYIRRFDTYWGPVQ